MLQYAMLSVALYAFWLLLSGHYTLMFLCFGLVSVALIIYLQVRMDKVDQEPAKVRFASRLPAFVLWLIRSVILSNIDVAKRIWHPDLPISPQWKKLPVKDLDPRGKTLYANCITLTPGTLTTDIGEDHFMVHSLSHDSFTELEQGEMERQIRQLRI